MSILFTEEKENSIDTDQREDEGSDYLVISTKCHDKNDKINSEFSRRGKYTKSNFGYIFALLMNLPTNIAGTGRAKMNVRNRRRHIQTGESMWVKNFLCRITFNRSDRRDERGTSVDNLERKTKKF